MKTFELQYGSGTVSVGVKEADIIGELKGNTVPPVSDIKAALYASLESPIDSPSLQERAKGAKSVALVVSDMSRFWMRQDLVIPHLVAYLETECGIALSDITVVIANGTHAPGSEEELRTLVTDAVFDAVNVINHDCRADDLVYMGTTSFGNRITVNRTVAEADLVVCLGACTHHVMAGFGGGRKSILPGVSSLETINYNHAFSLDSEAPRSNPLIGNGVLEGNPLHLDMSEAAAMVKNLFVINLVMNGEMQLSSIFSGHYMTSWLRGCEEVNRIYQVPVKEKADVIITSCGGYPKDMSLYQGTKAIDNVESGLKPGGTLIILMEAREGGGAPAYFDWLQSLKKGTLYEDLKANFTIPGYIFFLNCEQASRYRIMMLTSVAPELVAPMGIEAFNNMEDLLKAADIEGKSVYVIENASTVIPCVKG